jgi:hypothetical protein
MVNEETKEKIESLLIRGMKPLKIKETLQMNAGVQEIYTIAQKMRVAGRIPYRNKRVSPETNYGEILPCPFCGNNNAQFILIDTNAGWVQCPDCTGTGPYSQYGKAGAITLWNNRKGTIA